MQTRIIKTDKAYQKAINEAKCLITADPKTGTAEADRLELLTLLIEDFERKNISFDNIDPIDAIEFRMEEQGLRQKDLIPLLGSKSRVSEILNRKRQLTVNMIRALTNGLGIPADLLITESTSENNYFNNLEKIDPNKFPIKEMEKRGWFTRTNRTNKPIEDKLKEFLNEIIEDTGGLALYRRKFKGTNVDEKGFYSTLAWTARVMSKAKSKYNQIPKYMAENITPDTLRDLGRLSWFNDGPNRAINYLEELGIATIVEPRLPNSVIDGAAMLSSNGMPVIGLTLRIDRIDYFWFTLMHEVAHVWKHLGENGYTYIDRVDSIDELDIKEKEANRLSRDSLIQRAIWERSQANLSPTKKNIQEFADELHIHPAIVAGRIQFETGQYERNREYLGQGLVRKLFSDISF